jgi:hypothetical protein
MTGIYMSVEFWGIDDTGPRELLHSAIVTAEEIALHLKDYRGREHIITGFYLPGEVEGMTYTDRGLAHLDG